MKTDSANYKDGKQNYKGEFQFAGKYQKFLFSFMLLYTSSWHFKTNNL
jgi:hypothetical protein